MITDDIRLAMGNNKVTLLTLIDLSNAFNCVHHDALLSVPSSIIMSKSVTELFSSFFTGRRQRFKVDELVSDECDTLAGVPQGRVLSPLLFSVYINTLVSIINFSKFHLHADVVQLYKHFDRSTALQCI